MIIAELPANVYESLYRASGQAWKILIDDLCKRQNMPTVPAGFIYAEQADRIPQASGVYFLWSGLLCTYVGKSSNMRSRVMTHIATKEKFDPEFGKISFLEMSNDESDYSELFYIWLIRPANNEFTEQTTRNRKLANQDVP